VHLGREKSIFSTYFRVRMGLFGVNLCHFERCENGFKLLCRLFPETRNQSNRVFLQKIYYCMLEHSNEEIQKKKEAVLRVSERKEKRSPENVSADRVAWFVYGFKSTEVEKNMAEASECCDVVP
jgi:hypothetical protein